MIRSGLTKFFLGFILAIALILGGGVATAVYFLYKVTILPPKPVFANEKPTVKAKSPPTGAKAKRTAPASSKTPSPKPLEQGAYQARVTWPQGLSLRSEPNQDAERVGSVDYNQQIVVVEESTDKNWQRVRLKDGEQKGWVKAGNTERLTEGQVSR